VPVFVTEDSDATLRMGQADAVEGDEKARTAAAPADDPALAASKIGVRAQPGGGVELAFGPARNPALAVPFTAVGIVFAGVVVLLPRMEAPLPLLLVFGAIDLLVLAFALKLWTGTVRVRADREGLTVVRRILGIGRRTRIDARDVERIEAAIGWQSGRTVYYALRAVRRNGGTTGCGDGLRDKREAEGLAERLEGALRGD